MFLIQTRKLEHLRATDIINSAGDAKDWSNYTHQYEDIDSAKRECELLISSGHHNAMDVRIVEVVCTFNSEITVASKSDRY